MRKIWLAASLLPAAFAPFPAGAETTFTIPPESGHLLQVVQADPAADTGRTIIILQDAHVNEQAQRSIASILDDLSRRQGIHLILLEGADGNAGLSSLRRMGTPSGRRELAEKYLKDGWFSGAEYLDVISDQPLKLWGVEEQESYDRNFEAFFAVQRARAATLAHLGELKRPVQALAEKVWTPPMRALLAGRTELESEARSMGEYVKLLTDTMREAGVAAAGFPNLLRYAQALQLDREMDPARIAQEQADAVAVLRGRNPEAASSLASLALEVRDGKAKHAVFYRALAAALEREGITLSAYPAMDSYVRAIGLRADVDAKEFWQELEKGYELAMANLAVTEDAALLLRLGNTLALCERLMTLHWTPDDYARYQADASLLAASEWAPKLEELCLRWEVPVAEPQSVEELERTLHQAEKFYDLARARDAQIVGRSLERMQAQGETTAVLILGGFHTDRVAALFAKQGASVAIVTPNAGKDTDDARYAQVLLLKRESLRSRPAVLSALASAGESP